MDLPTTAPVQSAFGGGRHDVYVAKLGATGSSLIYATYLGGNGEDDVEDVAMDRSGNAILVGTTNSSNFPTRNALQPSLHGATDAFLVKLTATGSMDNSTYLGGAGNDSAAAVVIGANAQLYVTGITDSAPYQ